MYIDFFYILRTYEKQEIYVKEVASKDAYQESEERAARTSEDRYPSEDEGSSKLDIMSIPASEPYKPTIKRKVSKKFAFVVDILSSFQLIIAKLNIGKTKNKSRYVSKFTLHSVVLYVYPQRESSVKKN